MEQNIKVQAEQDVQKTEYLDKTGLDLLWTKVKENAQSQVETERDRAVAKENDIVNTKANATDLAALEEKVTANTAAIETKQPKGDYLTEHQDLSGYAKKSDVPTKVSSLTNDSKFITIDDVDFTPYAKVVDLTQLKQQVDANTSHITNITTSQGIPYDTSVTDSYQTDKSLKIKISDTATASISPYNGVYTMNGNNSHVQINPTYISILNDNFSFNVNPDGIIYSYGQFVLQMNSNSFKTQYDNTAYTLLSPGGLSTKVNDNNYVKITYVDFIDIKQGNIDGIGEVKISPNYLLLKKGENYLKFDSNSLSIGDENVYMNIGPHAIQGSVGLMIGTPTEGGSLWMYSDKLIINGDGGSITYDGNGISRSNYSISFKDSLINGFNINVPGFGDLTYELTRLQNSKQDKITPTTELDLTSIDTADIESLRSIVKSLATELNTLGLIKLKGAS